MVIRKEKIQNIKKIIHFINIYERLPPMICNINKNKFKISVYNDIAAIT